MNYYYAIFKKTKEAVEVEFPDLQGCCTFGSDWEEALENAEDVLAAWLVNADPEFINPPSKHSALENVVNGELVPILIDQSIKAAYRKLKRFNVIFPVDVVNQIDRFRKKRGLKWSAFLQKAAEEYLQQHMHVSKEKS